MIDKIKAKWIISVMLLVSVIFYIWVYVAWGNCPVVDCSEKFIDNWLRTVGAGTPYLIGYFAVALLLPVRYVKSWLKYIFSWGFPLVVYLTYITTGSSSIPAYGKVDVVRFWGIFFVLASVLFVLGHLVYDCRKKKTVKK